MNFFNSTLIMWALKMTLQTSRVIRWLRVYLPMQGTWVPSPVQDEADEPHWACVLKQLKPAHLEPVLHNKRGTAVRSPYPAMKSSPCLPQLEKARSQQWRASATKNNEFFFFLKTQHGPDSDSSSHGKKNNQKVRIKYTSLSVSNKNSETTESS